MAEDLSSKLTWAEFIAVFRKYDADGNGYIQGEELEKFLEDLQTSLGDKFKDLSKDEFKAKVMTKDPRVYEDGKIELLELSSILVVEKENFLKTLRKQSKDSKITFVDFIKIWKHFDADRSGYLDKLELEAFYLDLFSGVNKKDDEELKTKIKAMAQATLNMAGGKEDTKKISIKELAKVLPVEENVLSLMPTMSEETFDATFDNYDENNSGCIEINELEKLLKDLGLEDKKNAGIFHELFEQLDDNKDKKIQKRELQLLFKK